MLSGLFNAIIGTKMTLFLDLAITFAVAIAIYQAFRFGRELALVDFMRDHVEAIRSWHLECYELKQEVKRLNLENKQLKQRQENRND